MVTDEQILFPMIREFQWASRHPGCCSGGVNRSVKQIQQSHDAMSRAVALIGHLTDGFTPPANASIAYRSLLAGLNAMEVDIRRHRHTELDVLLPRAVAAETALTGPDADWSDAGDRDDASGPFRDRPPKRC